MYVFIDLYTSTYYILYNHIMFIPDRGPNWKHISSNNCKDIWYNEANNCHYSKKYW